MDEHKKMEDKEASLSEEITARRNQAVQNFQMNFDIEEIPDVTPEYDNTPISEAQDPVGTDEKPQDEILSKQKEKPSKSEGCLMKLLYTFLIVGVSGFLASMMLIFVLDSMAINRSEKAVDLEIPSGATTSDIADALVEKGLIDNAFCFRIYSKIAKADGKWQPGAFIVSPDMGYATLVETLQVMTPRETVTVTIPEGFTVEEMAKLLKEKGVCEPESFYEAVVHGDFDYDFIEAIPDASSGHYGRCYRLEGYLFPDTYNFYVGSSGETVVERMLENFDRKLTPELRQQIADRGWTIDQAVIMASLIEGEAASDEDMEKVSRVLQNRMVPGSGFPKLQLCSTRDYVRGLMPTIKGVAVTSVAYNTYEREGLPVGAINNPGLRALNAALNPSNDAEVAKCYFFATDYKTGITYYSETLSQHNQVIRKYGITDLG